jgi:hypothetical protein
LEDGFHASEITLKCAFLFRCHVFTAVGLRIKVSWDTTPHLSNYMPQHITRLVKCIFLLILVYIPFAGLWWKESELKIPNVNVCVRLCLATTIKSTWTYYIFKAFSP